MKRLFLLILPFAFLSCDSGSTPKATPDVPGDTPKEEEEITGGPDAFLDGVLSRNFSGIVDVKKDGKTYTHLLAMAEEAVAQTKGTSKAGLPLLYQQENFPTAYNYFMGWDVDTAAVYKTMIGWLSAMQLSELCPAKRNALYKAGYEAGGYTMNSNIYGYHFKNDPNVARLVASAVYAAMHTTAKPDIAAMRTEVGGSQFGKTLAALYDDEPRNHVTDDAFYVDLRKFMASAPGPYAPGYTDRSSLNPTFPDDKSSNGCLTMDMSIYFTVTGRYVLPEERTVQAIADEDGDVHHLFGTDKVNIDGQYDIKAVFGAKTIGESIDPEGKLPQMIDLMFKTGSSARGILQHADASLGGIEYGRLRPGCSEEKEGQRKSYYDDRLNVLTCFAIEDNDGHKTECLGAVGGRLRGNGQGSALCQLLSQWSCCRHLVCRDVNDRTLSPESGPDYEGCQRFRHIPRHFALSLEQRYHPRQGYRQYHESRLPCHIRLQQPVGCCQN